MKFRTKDAHQNANQKNQDQKRLQCAVKGMTSSDFDTLGANLLDTSEALASGGLRFFPGHALAIMLLRQQFEVKDQFFVNLSLDLLTIEWLPLDHRRSSLESLRQFAKSW